MRSASAAILTRLRNKIEIVEKQSLDFLIVYEVKSRFLQFVTKCIQHEYITNFVFRARHFHVKAISDFAIKGA
jgi:hypothetical protein